MGSADHTTTLRITSNHRCLGVLQGLTGLVGGSQLVPNRRGQSLSSCMCAAMLLHLRGPVAGQALSASNSQTCFTTTPGMWVEPHACTRLVVCGRQPPCQPGAQTAQGFQKTPYNTLTRTHTLDCTTLYCPSPHTPNVACCTCTGLSQLRVQPG